MPIQFARSLTAPTRSARADRALGTVLAFVAGATNAGAFLAVGQYTSHMTGIVSSMADHVVLGGWSVVAAGFAALLAFVVGAAVTAILVNAARQRGLHSAFSAPLLLEAVLLLVFGLIGSRLAQVHGISLPATVLLLCFTMGLQNALITKISRAEIRTTHVTGIVTDLGIELGRLVFRAGSAAASTPVPLPGSGERLRMLSQFLAAFFAGGVAGAVGFSRIGHLATLPLAIALGLIAAVPAWDDLRARARH